MSDFIGNREFLKDRKWRVAHGRDVSLGSKSVIMGILNVTPDSFSDGNLFSAPERAVEHAFRMIEEGATIIDIGGESTRPGAIEISQEEEEKRVMPIIDALVRQTDVILSIDTFKPKTALRAIEAGVHIINDVYSLRRSPEIADIAAQTGAGILIMRTGRERDRLPDLLEDQTFFLEASLKIAKEAGVSDQNIVIDPGFGFHKEIHEDVHLISHFETIHSFGYPILVGISRKRIIGTFTGGTPEERDVGTAAAGVVLRFKGASIFRVHNIPVNRQALAFADGLLNYDNEFRPLS